MLDKFRDLPKGAQAGVVVGLLAVVWFALGLITGGLGGVKNVGASGTVVAFGDSLTEGMGATPDQSYPAQLSRLWGVKVINSGISGHTTGQGLERMQQDCLDHKPGLVLLCFGGNDFLQRKDLEQAEANLRTMIRAIQGEGAAVVLLGLNIGGPFQDFPGMYERVAEEEGCLFLEDWMDGILGDDDLKSDEIHPNGKGYGVLAERIDKRARRLFEKMGS